MILRYGGSRWQGVKQRLHPKKKEKANIGMAWGENKNEQKKATADAAAFFVVNEIIQLDGLLL